MPTCPSGHDSETDDWCDVCGTPMDGPAPAPVVPVKAAPLTPAPALTCPACHAPREGRFCEECGHDSLAPAPAPPPSTVDAGRGWVAVVLADRGWFDEVRRREGPDAAGLKFPPYCPERRFALTGAQVAIGRRSVSRGTHPEIDLSGPPLDPGVSAQHALLVARPGGGGWAVVDLGSTNGTCLDDDPAPLRPHTPAPLADGTRVRLGAWTTITIGRTPT